MSLSPKRTGVYRELLFEQWRPLSRERPHNPISKYARLSFKFKILNFLQVHPRFPEPGIGTDRIWRNAIGLSRGLKRMKKKGYGIDLVGGDNQWEEWCGTASSFSVLKMISAYFSAPSRQRLPQPLIVTRTRVRSSNQYKSEADACWPRQPIAATRLCQQPIFRFDLRRTLWHFAESLDSTPNDYNTTKSAPYFSFRMAWGSAEPLSRQGNYILIYSPTRPPLLTIIRGVWNHIWDPLYQLPSGWPRHPYWQPIFRSNTAEPHSLHLSRRWNKPWHTYTGALIPRPSNFSFVFRT